MILDLRAFEDFPAKATIRADRGELSPFAESVISVEHVEAELAIQRSADEYFCQGQVTARVVLECARCLAEFESELSGPTDFIACSEEDVARYNGGDSEDYIPFSGNALSVDLVVPVRQALMFGLPMKPLCADDCRGLCQNCGTNLNKKTCDCKTETTDPRWNGLKGLDLE